MPTLPGAETMCIRHPTGIQMIHECYPSLSLHERKMEAQCTYLVQTFKLASDDGDQSFITTFTHGPFMSDKFSHDPGNIKKRLISQTLTADKS